MGSSKNDCTEINLETQKRLTGPYSKVSARKIFQVENLKTSRILFKNLQNPVLQIIVYQNPRQVPKELKDRGLQMNGK